MDDAFHFGMHADELALRDDNFAAYLLQCHDFAEFGFFGQFPVLLVVTQFATLFALQLFGELRFVRAAALAAHDEQVAVPEVFLHLAGDGDGAAFVMYGSVWNAAGEDDAMVGDGCFFLDGAAQGSFAG